MGLLVVNGAMLKCSFGTAPSSMAVLPACQVLSPTPAATIMDNVPMLNIMPFAMCTTVSNPQVASATAAALGVLTPMPCIPTTTAPWVPGTPTVLLGGKAALNDSCKLMCMWGGVIEITYAGQTTVMVP